MCIDFGDVCSQSYSHLQDKSIPDTIQMRQVCDLQHS